MFCNIPRLCKGSVIEIVQKRQSTPWNIFYVPRTAMSSGRRVGVNFSLLCNSMDTYHSGRFKKLLWFNDLQLLNINIYLE